MKDRKYLIAALICFFLAFATLCAAADCTGGGFMEFASSDTADIATFQATLQTWANQQDQGAANITIVKPVPTWDQKVAFSLPVGWSQGAAGGSIVTNINPPIVQGP